MQKPTEKSLKTAGQLVHVGSTSHMYSISGTHILHLILHWSVSVPDPPICCYTFCLLGVSRRVWD